MDLKKIIASYLGFLIALVASFTAGYLFHDWVTPSQVDFLTLADAYEQIKVYGYYEMPAEPAMEYGAVHGLVGAYGDPHTRFEEPYRAELSNDRLTGSFGGIGVQLSRDQNGAYVLHPYAGGSADEAGVKDGDRLIGVDGSVIAPEMSTDEVTAAIRGPVDQQVTIRVSRPPQSVELEFKIIRDEIYLPSVNWFINPTPSEPMGVIRVNVIAASTPDEIIEAVSDLESQGVTHFVLDLRDNAGGLLEEGVEIARLFLTDGVVIQKQTKGESVTTYEIKEPGPLADIPLVVLVNGGTASAAEIIAGPIKQHHRASLIGTATTGKDTVQFVFELIDTSSLYVTSAKWWVPGLSPPVGEAGIQPDITIDSTGSETTDPFLDASGVHFFGQGQGSK